MHGEKPCPNLERHGGNLVQDDTSGGGEKCLNYGYFLKSEHTGFTNECNVR